MSKLDIDDIEDRPEYLHGCKHGVTALRGCRLGCKSYDEVLVTIVPGRDHVPIVATPEEYERRTPPTGGEAEE